MNLKDIAKKADVSRSTISRVINDYANVRSHVWNIIRQENFQHNHLARARVGFDDADVASQSIPMLTTVRHPLQDKGSAAAELLIDLAKNRVESPRQTLLKTELVIRQSCGANRLQ